jgi:hypothetical protein
METVKVIHLGNFKQVLEETTTPFTDKIWEALVTFLKADSLRVGRAVRKGESEALSQKEANADHVQEEIELNKARIEQAQRYVDSIHPGCFAVGLVSLICFVACFTAEYVFNAAVLPWLVNVEAGTLLGIALSMAPATAPVILDRVIVTFFGIDDGWEMIKGALSPANRIARHTVRLVFMVAIGVLNLYAIRLLAEARGIAMFLHMQETVTDITILQQSMLDMALLMVSIAVTVDGAMFYLFGLHEMRTSRQLAQAKQQLTELENREGSLGASRSVAKADLATARRHWEDIADLEKIVADAYVAEGMVLLEEKAATVLPVDELVKRLLGRKENLAGVNGAESAAADALSVN